MPGIPRELAEHALNVNPNAKPVKQSLRRFSEPNRWGNEGLEETPLRPELVAEVRFDKVQGNRFRHGTKLIRFRDDKNPDQCTWREVRPPKRADDPTVENLLERA